MQFVEIEKRNNLAPLFESCEDATILSAISGKNGSAYADNEDEPKVAMMVIGDYVFITGSDKDPEIKKALDILDKIYKNNGFNIRTLNKELDPVIEKHYRKRIYKYYRFATLRTFKYMDFKKLEEAVIKKSKDYTFSLVNKELYQKCKETEWMRDFVIGFDTYEEWEKDGLGVLILKDGEPVSGATSYSAYPGGIEIEIITREDMRNQGLAFAGAAALLLECKKRGLVASWDAAHEDSLRLAERLGYRLLYRYEILGIKDK